MLHRYEDFDMTDRTEHVPPPDTLPSASALWRAAVVALVVALVLAVTVVLPAERGWDPTGAGEALGLAEMGRVKTALAEAAATDAARDAASRREAEALLAGVRSAAERADTTRITLAPGESIEVKLVMREDTEASYAWSTDRGTVAYDRHADRIGARSDDGAPGFVRYAQGGGAWSRQGTLAAAFDGRHGWFWSNATADTLTITLRTEGAYLGVVGAK